MTKGFKAMNSDMTCRNFKFEVGKTYEITNGKQLEMCTDSGFHFCKNLENVFNYYDFTKCRLFEVEAFGDVVADCNKSATKKLKIVRELAQDDLNNYRFQFLRHDLWFKDRTDEELLKYKNHYDYKIRRIVVRKLKDLNLMFNTFKNDSDLDVRVAVVECMKDLGLMFDTFRDDPDLYIRAAVVRCMKDLSLMFQTFKDDPEYFVRESVIEQMTDLKLMFETFKNDLDKFVRIAVIKKNDRH